MVLSETVAVKIPCADSGAGFHLNGDPAGGRKGAGSSSAFFQVIVVDDNGKTRRQAETAAAGTTDTGSGMIRSRTCRPGLLPETFVKTKRKETKALFFISQIMGPNYGIDEILLAKG